MSYAYWEKEMNYSIKGAVLFSLRKIKKLYPLHIITMLGALILILPNAIKLISVDSVVELIGQILANVFLIKAFIPKENIYFSLNGVSWYLSVCIFLYVFFPFVQKKIKKISVIKAIRNIFILYGVQIAIVAIIFIFNYFYNFNQEIITGLTYISPFFRSIDFLAGVNLCVLFKKRSHNWDNKMYTFLEIILVMAIVAISVIFSHMQGMKNKGILIDVLGRSAVVFLPISLIFVYLFAVNKGGVSKIMTNKFCVYVGNISAYTFLIHSVVIRYLDVIISKYKINIDKVSGVILAFIFTLIISAIYVDMEELYLKKISRNKVIS